MTDKGFWFRYTDGRFEEIDPLVVDMEEGTWADLLGKIGFISSQQVGDECGLHYNLYESSNGGYPFLVDFSTAGFFCEILCPTWPDLIQLLSLLSPIVLAGCLREDELGQTMLSVISHPPEQNYERYLQAHRAHEKEEFRKRRQQSREAGQ